MTEKISVIVPVYNAERFLTRCIDSILNQTYTNIELLLVNDGSKDNSLALCHRIAAEDARVVVLDKPNGGAASARNMGLDYATGDYIGFCDADDYLDLEMYEVLLHIMKDNGLSVIDSLSKVYDEQGNIVSCGDNSRRMEKISVERAIKDIFIRKGNVSLCTRLFKKDVIKNLRIPEGKRVEDFYFTICFLSTLKENVIYHYPFYNCCINSSSVTQSATGSIYIDALYFYDLAIEYLSDAPYKLDVEKEYYLLKMYYLLAISSTREERIQYKDQFDQYKADLIQHTHSIFSNTYLRRRERIILCFSCISFKIGRVLYLLKEGRC